MDVTVQITISNKEGFYHATEMVWRGVDTDFVSFLNDKRAFLKGPDSKKEGELTVAVTASVDSRIVIDESATGLTRQELKNMEQRFFHVGNELIKWADDRDKKKGKK